MERLVQKKIIIIFILFIILIFVIFIFFLFMKDGNVVSKEVKNVENTVLKKNLFVENVSVSENNTSSQNVESTTRTPYEQKLKALQTMPLTQADYEEFLHIGSKEKFKLFKLKITENGYIPDAIIVEKGDNVQLDIFSEKDTDIQSQDFNFYLFIPAKKTVSMGFLTSNEGTFVFYCRNQCLGKERIFGHIVVRPRS